MLHVCPHTPHCCPAARFSLCSAPWAPTALLIEYEDMFPYEGHLRLLRAPHAYRYLPREGGHLGTWVGQVRTSPGGTACLSF